MVITLGPHGAFARVAGEVKEYFQKCPPVKKVLDTTGAGDAFVAGFLYSYLVSNEGDLQSALKWGVAAGSSCVTKVGASAKPSKDDLMSHLI